MRQEIGVAHRHEVLAAHECDDRQRKHEQHKERKKRIPELRKEELKLEPGRQPADEARRVPQQHHDQAARPLEFLRHEIAEGSGAVTMGDGIQRMHTPPAAGIHHQCRRMVFSQLRTEAADLFEGDGTYRVMRPYAHRRQAAIVTGLERAMHAGLGIEPSTCRPAFGSVLVANAGGRDIADLWIGERTQHVEEIVGRGNMICIELRHEIVAAVAVVVVEEGEVAFLAPRASGPRRPMIIGSPLAGRDEDPVPGAPVESLGGRVFVGKPGVVFHLLGKHCQQGFTDDREGFRRRLGHDHGHSTARRQAQGTVRSCRPIEDDDEIGRQSGNPGKNEAHRNCAESIDVMARLQPPDPEIGEGADPYGRREQIFGPPMSGQNRDKKRLVGGFRSMHRLGDRRLGHARASSPKNGAAVRTMVSRSEYRGWKQSVSRARLASA